MPAEEYLAVSDLTELTNVTDDDYLVVQSAGENGDVMLSSIASIMSGILDLVYAPIDSPEFTGDPTVPDISDLTTDDQKIANTAFVQAIAELKADVDAPTFTGQAHFSDNVPTTEVNGDTVNLATQLQITTLQNSIDALTTSVNTLSATLASKTSFVTFTNKADFKKKIYGGSAAVMTGLTPYMFRGDDDFSVAVLGSGKTGRCWGICFCYSANTVYFLFVYAANLYMGNWASSSDAFTTTKIT